MATRFTRRQFVKSLAAVLALTPIVAGLRTQGSGRARSARSGHRSAQKEAPTTAPQTQPLPAAAEKFTITMATYADPRYDWQRYWAKQWADAHPNVDLKVEDVVYGEMAKKQLAMVATGTLWDATYSGIKFFPYSVAKGCFMALNDLDRGQRSGYGRHL